MTNENHQRRRKPAAEGLREATAKEEAKNESKMGRDLAKGADRFEETLKKFRWPPRGDAPFISEPGSLPVVALRAALVAAGTRTALTRRVGFHHSRVARLPAAHSSGALFH